MPIVEVNRDLLIQKLGRELTQKEFHDLCFDFGIELDDVTSQLLQLLKEKHLTQQEFEDRKEDADFQQQYPDLMSADSAVLYKIDVPANRYDLLCVEGLTRALRIFNKDEKHPIYRIKNVENMYVIRVHSTHCNLIRPFIVGAVLRNLSFDETSFNSFIRLQEKLHFNICRHRSLVAIGTHDLDTLSPDFVYDARPGKDIVFRALKEETEMSALQLFDKYRNDPLCSVAKYLPLIEESPVFPVIYDSKEVLCSLPPIINGDHSKITLNTKNVFIDSTATDLTKAKIVLNTLVSMFSEYCTDPFVIEPVRVEYYDNLDFLSSDNNNNNEADAIERPEPLSSYVVPDFDQESGSYEFTTNTDYINRGLGTQLATADIVDLLYRMGLDAKIVTPTPVEVDGDDAEADANANTNANAAQEEKAVAVAAPAEEAKEEIPPTANANGNGVLVVRPPPTRSDILHAVDIMEDVAIAHGYNNIERRLPIHATTAKELPINALSDKVRYCVALCGYDEVLNWALLSKSENFSDMRIDADTKVDQYVRLIDPKARDLFEICRTNLLPGVLKILRANVGKEKIRMPLKLFEVGDVVLCDAQSDTGARNERRLSALYCSTKNSGLEHVHGLMDRVMQQNEVCFLTQHRLDTEFGNEWPFHLPQRFYSIRPSNVPTFFPGRQAQVLVDNVPVGYFGIVHPNVIANFGIMRITPVLVSALEINVETFLHLKVTTKQSQIINQEVPV